MTLVLDELFDGVTFTQNFRIQKTMQLVHFRPWIIKWGTPPAGDMVLQILKDAVILKEVRLTAAEINAAIPATFFHGQLRFDLEPLQLNYNRKEANTEYQVKIFMDGYVTDSDNFYGLIRRYEQKFYPTYGAGVTGGEAVNDTIEPLGFELFEYTY